MGGRLETLFVPGTVILVGDIEIRPITDLETLRAVESLQQEIWGMPDRDVVPAHQLLAAAGAGGVTLAAFAAGGTMIGFCYGFVGLREGRPLLYSHMAGVADGWRSTGVGFQLKRAQREEALARGLDRIVWTFDPLQSANAHFNLHKLGAEARRYYVNYYGEMPDELNRGIESDRLEVEWPLTAPRVVRAMTGTGSEVEADAREGAAAAQFAIRASGDPPRPEEAAPLPEAPTVRLAVPGDFTDLRRRDPARARAWREATRRAFLAYFGRGYAAVDFQRSAAGGFYVLRVAVSRDADAD